MKQYLLPLLAAATLIASGCASTPASTTKAAATAAPAASAPAAAVVSAAEAEKAKAAIAAAEKSRDAAAAVGFEWRDTSELIGDAKKALAANDSDKAIKLAGEAERQGELAVKQHAIEMAKKH